MVKQATGVTDGGIGVKMTEDFARMAHGGDKDSYSLDARLNAYREVERIHLANVNKRRARGHEVFFISGDMGTGKTLLATVMLLPAYLAGAEVYSTTSLLFGYRVDPELVFTFAEFLPPGSYLFIDEAHVYADRYGENSIRQRTLSSSVTMLRKRGIRMILASANEPQVAGSLKQHVETLIYPRITKWRDGMDGYPTWCYLDLAILGPSPWQGRRMGDEWGGVGRHNGQTRLKFTPTLNPRAVYQAGKLLDTWAQPQIAAGILTSGAAIRRRLLGADGAPVTGAEKALAIEDQARDLLKAIYDAIIGGIPNPLKKAGRRSNLHYRAMANVARGGGWEGDDSEASKCFKVLNIMNSQYEVRVPAMLEQLKQFSSGKKVKWA